MVRPTDVQLAAFKRIATMPDGYQLMEWLEECLQLVRLGLENEENEIHLRWKQGASKTLRTIKRTITDAKETIHKREEGSNE